MVFFGAVPVTVRDYYFTPETYARALVGALRLRNRQWWPAAGARRAFWRFLGHAGVFLMDGSDGFGVPHANAARTGETQTIEFVFVVHNSVQQRGALAVSTTCSEAAEAQENASWLPLILVVLTQIQTTFAVIALSVSMGSIAADLHTSATSVGIALTAGTFTLAASILLGAKLGDRFGSRRVFQIGLILHGVAMAGVVFSVSPTMLIVAQASSGAVIGLIAPALTVFIASNFKGEQQAVSIGFLAAAIPAAGVLALLIAGTFSSSIGWRYSFALVGVLSLFNLILSFKLKPIPAHRGMKIDWPGAALAAGSVILLSIGFSGLNSWGLVLAAPHAPFSILGLSPAPLLIILGAALAQIFFLWLRRGHAQNKPRILNLEVLDTASERAVSWCMAVMLFVATAATFLIPLYIQMVQGRTGLQTAIAIIPYALSVFIASTGVVRLYGRFSPRQIARTAFLVDAVGLLILAFTIDNDWGALFVVIGLITLGLGQGAIVALVFNTLLSSAPKELAGDVGAWRGLVHNLSGSIGIAVASMFAVGVLGGLISASVADHSEIQSDLVSRVNFNNANFATNDDLKNLLAQTSATPEQVEVAVAINTEARLRASNISLLALAAVAVLAIVPARRMPGRLPEDFPDNLAASASASDHPADKDRQTENPS